MSVCVELHCEEELDGAQRSGAAKKENVQLVAFAAAAAAVSTVVIAVRCWLLLVVKC